MGFCRSACRSIAEFLSSILLLCSVALLSLGGFLLFKWRNDANTQDSPPPGYVLGLLVLGGGMALSNFFAFLGACSKTKGCLWLSSILSFILLVAQAALAALIFLNPGAIDQQVCPPGDEACLDKLDNLFKDPQVHAGVLLALVCGVQCVALFSVCCLQGLQKHKDGRDQEEANSLERGLLEEREWNERRDQVEKKARRKMDLHKSALSATTRSAIERREGQNPPLFSSARNSPNTDDAGAAV